MIGKKEKKNDEREKKQKKEKERKNNQSKKYGKALYDPATRLWCNGPSYIVELYKEELKKS